MENKDERERSFKRCPKCGGRVSGDGRQVAFYCETVNRKHFFEKPGTSRVYCTAALVVDFLGFLAFRENRKRKQLEDTISARAKKLKWTQKE